MNMKLGSIERKKIIDVIRKKKGIFVSGPKWKKTVRPTQKVSPKNIIPCLYCQWHETLFEKTYYEMFSAYSKWM